MNILALNSFLRSTCGWLPARCYFFANDKSAHGGATNTSLTADVGCIIAQPYLEKRDAEPRFRSDTVLLMRTNILTGTVYLTGRTVPVPINFLQKRGVGSHRYEAPAATRECSINQYVITGITRL